MELNSDFFYIYIYIFLKGFWFIRFSQTVLAFQTFPTEATPSEGWVCLKQLLHEDLNDTCLGAGMSIQLSMTPLATAENSNVNPDFFLMVHFSAVVVGTSCLEKNVYNESSENNKAG